LEEKFRQPNLSIQTLKQLQVNQNALISEINSKLKQVVQIKENLKEVIQFTPNLKFDNDLFGNFLYDNIIANGCGVGPFKMPSKILTEAESLKLIKLCDFSEIVKWTLLYRGSRDGFSAKEFHSKCDGHSNTLTIIKGKANINNVGYFHQNTNIMEESIFGGFASVAWDSSCTSKTDSNSFIFSFTTNENKPFIKKINPSLVMDPDCGPIFGDNTIFISDNSNQNNSNRINFESETYSNVNAHRRYGHGFRGYRHPTVFRSISTVQQNPNQGTAFAVVEIEIYQQDPLITI
jgi:hypothetical protein